MRKKGYRLLEMSDLITEVCDWLDRNAGLRIGMKDRERLKIFSVHPPQKLIECAFPSTREPDWEGRNCIDASYVSACAAYVRAQSDNWFGDAPAIFVPSTFDRCSLADVGTLIHEVVHHIQAVQHRLNVARAAREAEAYRMELKFLNEFGVSTKETLEYMKQNLFH